MPRPITLLLTTLSLLLDVSLASSDDGVGAYVKGRKGSRARKRNSVAVGDASTAPGDRPYDTSSSCRERTMPRPITLLLTTLSLLLDVSLASSDDGVGAYVKGRKGSRARKRNSVAVGDASTAPGDRPYDVSGDGSKSDGSTATTVKFAPSGACLTTLNVRRAVQRQDPARAAVPAHPGAP